MKVKASVPTLAAVVIPLLVLIGWWLRLHTVIGTGPMLAFGVEGYDPRDLLSGHYLTYRVKYSPDAPCASQDNGQELCLCFAQSDTSIIWKGACADKPPTACSNYLRGVCRYTRFEAGIERFYIPEKFASTNPIPEGAAILVALDGNGGGIVKEFFVGQKKLLEWLREQKHLVPPSTPPTQ